ncbi:protein DD3-3-like [Haliotis cracherodii]|uniref:protein DD3-3-like n=1 Tax=Haliotis cracherodii TaxID=6455 RepID=UPI0039ED3E87
MSLFLNILSGIIFIISSVEADIYLHNFRGSNNRLDETTRPRTNEKRMFNSQNNARGGYNVGSLFYYQGSLLPIEWTNQHSCHDANSHCEIILQYMCGDTVRDGATTKTIPETNAQCLKNDCNSDRTYGMHEDYNYYNHCKRRQRNKGLFVADQNLNNRNRQFAPNTRQNPAGTRYGYECPEERDYYPYWHPTPWKDIAVMTNDAQRCLYYRAQSENVKSRWACVLHNDSTTAIPNNKEDCEQLETNGVKGQWKEFPSHGLPPPDCRETDFSRDNHLGNGIGGHPLLYNWTVPNISHEKCVMRIRYNVSTNDYDGWNTNYSQNGNPTKIKMADKYGFSTEEAAGTRGYKFKNNPEVKLFDDADFSLQLAINTAQYGRVFQDRSHTFAIRPRPDHIDSTSTIHNLNVRGKRGNIVQVYPSVEYDFVPNTLEMGTGEYVHFQWTGSNTNNRGNDGNGLAGTDRNNIVLLSAKKYPEGSGASFGPGAKRGHFGVNYPEHVTNDTFLGLGRNDVEKLALLTTGQFGGEMSQLDDAGTYFNLDPRQITQLGTYHFMSTRNNDFSNRDQKARIMVYPYPVRYEAIGSMGGSVTLPSGNAKVEVSQGAFDRLQKLRLEEWSREEGDRQMQAAHQTMNLGSDYVSNFLVVYPQSQIASDSKTFTIELKVDSGSSDVVVYRSNANNFATWTRVDASIDGNMAKFQAQGGGVFVARSSSNIGMVVGIAIACIVIVVILIGTLVYFKLHPKKWQSVKNNAKYIQRSTQSKV